MIFDYYLKGTRATRFVFGLQCPIPFCDTMKNVMCHLRVCDPARDDCRHPDCHRSRQILQHWKNCELAECLLCSPFREIAPAYVENDMQNPLWYKVIVTKYQWLMDLMRVRYIPTPKAATGRPCHNEHAGAGAANVPWRMGEDVPGAAQNGNDSVNEGENPIEQCALADLSIECNCETSG